MRWGSSITKGTNLVHYQILNNIISQVDNMSACPNSSPLSLYDLSYLDYLNFSMLQVQSVLATLTVILWLEC